jgi:hypothetical protein
VFRTIPPSEQPMLLALPAPRDGFAAEAVEDGRHRSETAASLFTPTRTSAQPPGPNAWPPTVEAAAPPAGLVPPVDETIVLPIFQETSGWFQIVHPAAGPDGPTNWESASDAGWIAAAQAATPEVSELTSAGLPVRTPQRHLVPGTAAASETADGALKRDPAAIAAAMSAYARGVAGRRGNPAQ